MEIIEKFYASYFEYLNIQYRAFILANPTIWVFDLFLIVCWVKFGYKKNKRLVGHCIVEKTKLFNP